MSDNDNSDTQHSEQISEDGQGDPETSEHETDVAEADGLEAELAKTKDQLLRTIAESENIRRRASRDVENAHKFAVEKLLNDLFPVLDSLEKAVETASETEGASAIAEGVELSLKMFVSTLEKSGVAQIDPLGEPFDPQQQEAMAMVPNPDAEPNSVMEVMQKGYLLNERLVRAAKVIVTKAVES
ncbi:MAG: nucleotide exchange factor GrpE [Gammaproteobacteria bacterium]|nr:nucleotide exchange factor GrpE [Gammaproteobacteria bacterium]